MFINKKSSRTMCRDDMAEREGFEPSNGFKPLHDFQSCALDQLSHLSLQRSKRERLSIIMNILIKCKT